MVADDDEEKLPTSELPTSENEEKSGKEMPETVIVDYGGAVAQACRFAAVDSLHAEARGIFPLYEIYRTKKKNGSAKPPSVAGRARVFGKFRCKLKHNDATSSVQRCSSYLVGHEPARFDVLLNNKLCEFDFGNIAFIYQSGPVRTI